MIALLLTVALVATPTAPRAKAPVPRPVLVEVTTAVPDAVVELKYATDDNFMKRAVYPATARCLVLAPMAEKLAQVAHAVASKGYRLKFYDCYRPHSVQFEMWKVYPHKGYVAEPTSGSHHNRGAAVDLTLVTSEGQPVEMPTPYDTFSRAAFHSSTQGSAEARAHRDLLRTACEAAGLKRNPMEWWHYELPEAVTFPLRDESFAATE